MVRCSVLDCKSDGEQKIPGLSFHSFPNKQNLREIWISATGRNGWEPKKSSKICSKHFEASFLVKKLTKTYLDYDAVPTKLIKLTDARSLEDPLPSTSSKSTTITDSLSTDVIQCSTKSTPITSPKLTPRTLKRKWEREANKSEDARSLEDPLPSTSSKSMTITDSLSTDVIQCSTKSTPLTSPKLTPRTLKRKWKKEAKKSEERLKKMKALREKSRRLTKKVANLENILTELKSRSLVNNEDCDMLGSLDCVQKDFLKKVLGSGSINAKYSPALRKFALCLHFISPKAYKFVRTSFNCCLPHPSTLRSWYKSFDGSPGFTDESLECIKLLVKRAQGKQIYCALCLDEMAIRKHVQWDGKKCVGLINFGEMLDGHNVAVAREALVFMVTAVNDSWKIPVGYFLVDGCTGEQKANLVRQCVELVNSCGVNIISLTFDGCPANFSMVKSLECVLDPSDLSSLKTYFTVKNQEISIFPDPAHMLKLVRNTLGEKIELTNLHNQIISWEFIVNLNNLQNNEGLHLANRLRNQHVNYAKQIMKVKLAAQTFSNSVAESIELCAKDLGLADFVGSEATVEFIKNINKLFDILNSRNFQTYGFKKPINERNYPEIEMFLNQMENYIVGLKLKGKSILHTNRKVGFFGFYICIQSLKKVYRNLVASKILKFVPMYKMSQDHLECFFSSIRAKGGFNNNPTAVQFESAYKRLIVHGEIKHISSGNCIPLEDIKILTFSEMRYENKINLFTHTLTEDNIEESEESLQTIDTDHDYLADPSRLSLYTQEIVAYIAGFVVKKLRKVIKCEECLLSLITDKYYGLIARKDKGGLIYPSSSTIKICERAEKIFRMRSCEGVNFYSDKNLMQKLILSCFKDCARLNIFDNLHRNDNQSLIGNHRLMLLKAVAMHYFEVRIHHSTKQFFAPNNRIRNIHNKLVLFNGQ